MIAERGWERLLIMGHSTGGLIATLWAYSATGRARVDGLILNSPWFELNRPWFDRVIATRILHAVGEYATDYVLTHDPSPTLNSCTTPLEGSGTLTSALSGLNRHLSVPGGCVPSGLGTPASRADYTCRSRCY